MIFSKYIMYNKIFVSELFSQVNLVSNSCFQDDFDQKNAIWSEIWDMNLGQKWYGISCSSNRKALQKYSDGIGTM